MKITKLVHSCLLVEMPKRTALFDPGAMSESAVNVDSLKWLDDIFITHRHTDHVSVELVRRLRGKFPEVRITAPGEVVELLKREEIAAGSELPDGVELLDAPHEPVEPLAPQPEQFGYHYLDRLTHPGDSHSFGSTRAILALPMTAPWGAMVRAVRLALELKPQHIIPIHDWHWRDEARQQTYAKLVKIFAEAGITFHPMLVSGQPINISAGEAGNA